ncbi:hypothetical protein PCO87_07750 [Pectobacteriaceae bacterium C52]|nr:hypothetical protein PCO87_07750 [Pectobacteriaceae bacterium C52]
MKRISPERKTSVLAKLLPPYNMTVAAVVQREGISEATLHHWRNQAKTEGKPVCWRIKGFIWRVNQPFTGYCATMEKFTTAVAVSVSSRVG